MLRISMALTAAAICAAPVPSFSQDTKKELIRSCVKQASQELQTNSARDVAASGGVTCPSGDIVGFPPRSRKHNRSSTISVAAGSGRLICPGTIPTIRNESSNGGSRGNFTFDANRDRVLMTVSCSGAGPGSGRRWYNADLVAKSCVKITDEIVLDLTLECAAKLN